MLTQFLKADRITDIRLYNQDKFRHYTTSRKVAGSIPDEVTGFLN
jgi:hypothetical protein